MSDDTLRRDSDASLRRHRFPQLDRETVVLRPDQVPRWRSVVAGLALVVVACLAMVGCWDVPRHH